MINNFPIQSMDLKKISSPFGPRIHPITKANSFHYGVDYPCPEGTPIFAIASGKVVVAKMQQGGKGLGNYVTLLHTDGTYSIYAHLKSRHVYQGDIVKAGQQIGLSGNTGDSTGPHLHFGICRKYNAAKVNSSEWIDPLNCLRALEEEMVKDKDVIINGNKVACKMIVKQEPGGEVNYIMLRELEKAGIKVGYNSQNKCPEITTK